MQLSYESQSRPPQFEGTTDLHTIGTQRESVDKNIAAQSSAKNLAFAQNAFAELGFGGCWLGSRFSFLGSARRLRRSS